MPRPLIAVASSCLLTSVAHAGDQGDPAQSCDGNTYQMVECLKAKTAQWDKRMTVAYEQALKDAVPQQHDQLRGATAIDSISRRQLPVLRPRRRHHRPDRRRRMHAQHDRGARPRAGRPRSPIARGVIPRGPSARIVLTPWPPAAAPSPPVAGSGTERKAACRESVCRKRP
jgi:hypothetical protein